VIYEKLTKVSIITPLFNSENYILNTFKSIIGQTYPNWEWIVVDDNSTDSSFDIVKELAECDDRVVLLRNLNNEGAGASRNKAIRKASGRYIAFLDADDEWCLNKLEKQISFMLKNDYEFTYTQYQKFSNAGYLSVVVPPDNVNYNQLLYSNVIGCLTVVYDTYKLGKRYMPLIRKRQDMGLWLSILKDVPKAYCLQENLAKYRVDSGMTKNKISVLNYQWRFYREVVGLSFFRSAYTFLVYAYKGFIKSRI
jgi:teichuronic acid biosynthesis glycosyltransferase TuaG